MQSKDMVSLAPAKQALRSLMKHKLAGIPSEVVATQSNNVFTALQALQSYIDAQNISVYLSMPGGEIQTDAIVKHAFKAGKTVFVPYLHKPTAPSAESPVRVMDMVRLETLLDYQSLKRDKWGIPSIDPATVNSRCRVLGDPASSAQSTGREPGSVLDLILMPGVAFDMDCESGSIRRLGHGKGFYDHFIHRYSKMGHSRDKPPVLLYGLALAQQYLEPGKGESVPVAAHDMPLDGLILGDGGIKVASTVATSSS